LLALDAQMDNDDEAEMLDFDMAAE